MALQYPILFPYVQEQHRKTANQERKRHNARVLLLSYLREVNIVDYPGRMNEVIQSVFGIEDQRLIWIRYHQDELRADVYNNIFDAVNNGDTDAKSIGKRIVLPATYTSNPTYMM
ncbi:hypothetical protein V2J09_021372 [Rumex salicifolius]